MTRPCIMDIKIGAKTYGPDATAEKAEKLRRELEVRAEEAFAETAKERKLKDKIELQLRNSENEIEKIKSSGRIGHNSEHHDQSAEMAQRLRSQMEKLETEHAEAILKQQQKFNQDQASYQSRLEDSENERQMLETELEKLKDKLERSKLDELKESEDVVQELRNLHEREKTLLMEENSKLSSELERSLEISTRLQADRRQLEDEFADLQGKKETVAQWEQQISEIIQW